MNQPQFEAKVQLNDTVEIRWIFCHGFYSGRAEVKKVNRKSFTCELLEEVKTHVSNDSWPIGFNMRVPKFETKEWSQANGVFPIN